MTIAQLNIALGITGVSSVLSGLNQANAAVNSMSRNAGRMTGGAGGFGGFRGVFYDIQALTYGVRDMLGVLGSVSGVGVASQYESVRLQIEGITGSAQSAGQALAEFQKIGLSTRFDTLEVAKYGQQFLNLGDSVPQAGNNMRRTLDLAAAGGLQRSDFNRFMVNLGQIRSGGITGVADMRQMLSAAPGMGRIMGRELGLGRNATPKDLISAYRKEGPQGFFNSMMHASQQAGVQGAAGRMGPIDAFGNLMESVNLIMKPTGDIFLRVLTPLMNFVSSITTAVGSINQATNGFAGLFAIFAVGRAAFPLLVVGFQAAINKVQQLTVSLYALANVPMPGGGIGGGGFNLRGMRGLGNMARLGRLGRGLAGFGIPLALDYGTQALGNHIGGTRGDYLKNAGMGASFGLMLPGVWGKVIGAAIGGIGGLIYTRANQSSSVSFASTSASALNKIADATAATAKNTQKLTGTAIGGGARGRHAVSVMEAERALASAVYGLA